MDSNRLLRYNHPMNFTSFPTNVSFLVQEDAPCLQLLKPSQTASPTTWGSSNQTHRCSFENDGDFLGSDCLTQGLRVPETQVTKWPTTQWHPSPLSTLVKGHQGKVRNLGKVRETPKNG